MNRLNVRLKTFEADQAADGRARLWNAEIQSGIMETNRRGSDRAHVTYSGYSTRDGWEIVVKRPGEPLRLLDPSPRTGESALRLLANYLGDESRAADLSSDFAALTIRRFTSDWELSGSDIENVLTEIEILRARLRIALARG